MTETSGEKRDCFAWKGRGSHGNRSISGNERCTALQELVCERSECPFYKTTDQWRKELAKNNGTVNMNAILKAYAKERG